MKRHPVVHFEMPADDKDRVSKFYSEAFGWDMNKLGPEMNEYVLATTTETDKEGMPTTPGAINGGIYQKGEDETIHFVISVDNLKDHMEVVKKAGGKIKGEPMDIPGIGKFVMIEDTEGNPVGMLQPSEM